MLPCTLEWESTASAIVSSSLVPWRGSCGGGFLPAVHLPFFFFPAYPGVLPLVFFPIFSLLLLLYFHFHLSVHSPSSCQLISFIQGPPPPYLGFRPCLCGFVSCCCLVYHDGFWLFVFKWVSLGHWGLVPVFSPFPCPLF